MTCAKRCSAHIGSIFPAQGKNHLLLSANARTILPAVRTADRTGDARGQITQNMLENLVDNILVVSLGIRLVPRALKIIDNIMTNSGAQVPTRNGVARTQPRFAPVGRHVLKYPLT